MKILVCGGRDFANPKAYDHSVENKSAMDEYRFVQRELDKLAIEFSEEYNPNDNWLPIDICIITGGAKGVDEAAGDWVTVNWCSYQEFKANWAKYKKAAGPIRNQQMLDEGKPDLVVAFPGGAGTRDMIQRARKAGIEVRQIEYIKEIE